MYRKAMQGERGAYMKHEKKWHMAMLNLSNFLGAPIVGETGLECSPTYDFPPIIAHALIRC